MCCGLQVFSVVYKYVIVERDYHKVTYTIKIIQFHKCKILV